MTTPSAPMVLQNDNFFVDWRAVRHAANVRPRNPLP